MSTAEDTHADQLRDQVRERYASAARQAAAGAEATDCGCGQPADCGCAASCCGSTDTIQTPAFGAALYTPGERGELPETALLASLGCGNPTAVAELREGERVLDLGSGGGIDVLLSAKRVGPTGKAFGLDMTEEMLALARRNAERAGVANAEFLRGQIERIPLPAGAVDVIISNCVINLSVDKPAVFAEMARVLAEGGRIGISDVVADDRLSPEERAEHGNWVGCIAGALSRGEYQQGLAEAGFERVEVAFTHEVADGLHSAIVKAVKGTGHR
jgi:arsenite methyltransferase